MFSGSASNERTQVSKVFGWVLASLLGGCSQLGHWRIVKMNLTWRVPTGPSGGFQRSNNWKAKLFFYVFFIAEIGREAQKGSDEFFLVYAKKVRKHGPQRMVPSNSNSGLEMVPLNFGGLTSWEHVETAIPRFWIPQEITTTEWLALRPLETWTPRSFCISTRGRAPGFSSNTCFYIWWSFNVVIL